MTQFKATLCGLTAMQIDLVWLCLLTAPGSNTKWKVERGKLKIFPFSILNFQFHELLPKVIFILVKNQPVCPDGWFFVGSEGR